MNGFSLSQYGQIIPYLSGYIATYGYCGFNGIDNGLINDHGQRTANLLIDQFRKRQSLPKLISMITDQIQDLEYKISDFGKSKNIDASSGKTLDYIANIVGIERNGKSDIELRKDIYTQIFFNKSSGEPETLIEACRFFTKPTKLKYIELHPAKVLFEIISVFPLPNDLILRLEQIAVGGVKVQVSFANDNDETFELIDTGYDPSTSSLGLGEIDIPTEGGRFLEKF